MVHLQKNATSICKNHCLLLNEASYVSRISHYILGCKTAGYLLCKYIYLFCVFAFHHSMMDTCLLLLPFTFIRCSNFFLNRMYIKVAHAKTEQARAATLQPSHMSEWLWEWHVKWERQPKEVVRERSFLLTFILSKGGLAIEHSAASLSLDLFFIVSWRHIERKSRNGASTTSLSLDRFAVSWRHIEKKSDFWFVPRGLTEHHMVYCFSSGNRFQFF